MQVEQLSRAASRVDAIRAECSAIVSQRGVEPALAFLNGRTRFRFTGIYHVDPPYLRNLWLFDRENPRLNVSGEVKPLCDTYCAFTYATGAPFATPDAPSDPRLTQHSARQSIISYAGVPMRLEGGHLWGSLCHFDVRPRMLSPDERSVLESVAPLFVEGLVMQKAIAAPLSAVRGTPPRGSVAR
jgi:GAF domain-containing protein